MFSQFVLQTLLCGNFAFINKLTVEEVSTGLPNERW